MRQQMEQCDVTNIIHSAKIARMAEAHVRRAKSYMEGLKSEARKVKSEHNSFKKVGVENISRAIGDNRAQPMVTVERDRDTHHDGGKCGELTSNPRDIDAVVKRAWQAIHNGMKGCIETAVEAFLCKYLRYICVVPRKKLPRLTGKRVYESFKNIKESAGAMDGWSPKELSHLSLATCEVIAVMLNQIEQGEPWPRSSMHARVGFLEKEGAQVGKVTSYRPLTITSPVYRGWATMRLKI